MIRIFSKDVKLKRSQKLRLRYVLCEFILGKDDSLIEIKHDTDGVKISIQVSNEDWDTAMGSLWPKEDMNIEVKH